MTVHDISENSDHVVLSTDDAVHVIPVALIHDWIDGKSKPQADIVSTIIKDWLAAITSTKGWV